MRQAAQEIYLDYESASIISIQGSPACVDMQQGAVTVHVGVGDYPIARERGQDYLDDEPTSDRIRIYKI